MENKKIKQFVLIFALVAVILFLGLANEGKTGIGLFNNTPHTAEPPVVCEPIGFIISNLTRPA